MEKDTVKRYYLAIFSKTSKIQTIFKQISMSKQFFHSWLPKSLLLLIAAFIFTLGVMNLKDTSTLSTSIISPFPDVSEDNEQFKAISYLNSENILRGNADGNFAPKSTLNRAEWATILSRLANTAPGSKDYNNCFPDVTDEWFAPHVCLAKEQGWVKGHGSGFYKPADPIQDIELLTTLARLTNWNTQDNEIWYEPALNYAIDHNIYDESSPIKQITRKKTAEVIFRMLATIALGNDNYSTDLDDDVEANKLYQILNIELTNYEGEYLTTELSVKSDDESAELTLTQNDLPTGVEESDISIDKLELEDASEEILAVYNFEPDGLVLENPAKVQMVADYNPDSIPMLFHIVGENLEPVENLEIAVNEEKTQYIITADIASFSKYLIVGNVFKISSVDPGEKRVGEIFWVPITVTYPDTDKIVIVLKFPGTDTEFKWIMRLDEQFISGIWSASLEYDPLSVIDSPPNTKMSDGFFTYKQEFRCASPSDSYGQTGPGFIRPDVLILYNYHLLDENDVPGPPFLEIGNVKVWLAGTCVMPEAENLEIKTTCGGSLSVSGNLNKYHVETEKVKIFIKKAGSNGAFISFNDASYTINGGKFTYEAGLQPGEYEVGVSALMVGAYTTFPVTENQGFEIKECPKEEKPEPLPQCGEGLIECSGQCVDPQTDNNNCSACGIICNPGTSCSEGGCYNNNYYNYGTGIYND